MKIFGTSNRAQKQKPKVLTFHTNNSVSSTNSTYSGSYTGIICETSGGFRMTFWMAGSCEVIGPVSLTGTLCNLHEL